MCGRFTLTQAPAELMDAVGGGPVKDIVPRYNVAPGQMITAVMRDPEYVKPIIQRLIWGFVPSWAKDLGKYGHPINARAETAADKTMFKSAMRHNRCIIPADGFFEWKKAVDGKIPHYIYMKDKKVFGMAGLWDRWEGRDGSLMDTCLILTTSPNALVRTLHDRMPVILKGEDYEKWLNPQLQDVNSIMKMIGPAAESKMQMHEVSSAVNAVSSDSDECIKPFRHDPPCQQELLL